ncbi:hypothetical protein PG996_007875 [Apiospora saccharicola]|uniref:Lactonase family protein n=1 Tax=Apiospora saccharicola TaxID=335842 RepID=A0ABR1UWC9_9PEZI
MRSQQQLLRRPRWRWLAATMMVLLSMPTAAHARVHRLFAANRSPPPRLYALAFDDGADDDNEAVAITVTARLSADATHARIALDAARDNVYGVSLDKAAVASYEVVVTSTSTNNEEGENGGGGGGDDKTGTGIRKKREIANVTLAFRKSVAAFRAAAPAVREGVHGVVARGRRRLAAAADDDGNGKGKGGGVLEEVVQSWRYDERYASGRIAGMALDPRGFSIYSADLDGEALWAHSVSPDGTGRYDLLSPPPPEEQQNQDQDRNQQTRKQKQEKVQGGLATPQRPRHLVVHPSGRVLYVVTEIANAVVGVLGCRGGCGDGVCGDLAH